MYLYGVFIFALEVVADLGEGGHRPPARLQLARTRNAVAAALHPHQRRDGLQSKQELMDYSFFFFFFCFFGISAVVVGGRGE